MNSAPSRTSGCDSGQTARTRCGPWRPVSTRGNLSRTSSLLHLHVNTVTRRLDRVSRLLGDGWQDGDRALEIRVAIRLFRAGATAGSGR